MSALLIGLSGHAGAGKDSAAAVLMPTLSAFGFRTLGLAFADTMRDMLAAAGVPRDYMTRRELKESPVPGLGASYRRLAETLGTEWGRDCHGADFWLRIAGLRIAQFESSTSTRPPAVVLTDVRFPNEAAFIRQRGGVVVRVERPGMRRVTSHVSETALDDDRCDAALLNDGTLGDLCERVEALAAMLVAQHDIRRAMARPGVGA